LEARPCDGHIFPPLCIQNERLDAAASVAVSETEPLRLTLKGARQLLPIDALSISRPAAQPAPAYEMDSVGSLPAQQVLRPELIAQTGADLSVVGPFHFDDHAGLLPIKAGCKNAEVESAMVSDPVLPEQLHFNPWVYDPREQINQPPSDVGLQGVFFQMPAAVRTPP
jgi:hypothetical protein